jgi:hypothetical protein
MDSIDSALDELAHPDTTLTRNSNMCTARFTSVLVAAAIVIANGACATRTAGSDAAGQEAPATDAAVATDVVRVEVSHNRADGGTTTVYIEPAAGVRQTLGTIAPGERKTFSYRVEAKNRTVTLSAINASGQTLRSSQITVPQGAGLAWDLQVNSLRLKR